MTRVKRWEDPEDREDRDSNLNLATSLTIVDRSLGRLIGALKELDEIQKTAMSVGVRSNTAMDRMGDTIKNHPGGMKNAFQSALSFMQVGLMKHSRGMLHLAQVTKATGQDITPIISGFAKLGSVMPLSAKAMGNLGNQVVELSQTWGIQTGALMKVLEKHADTISRLAALGGDPVKATKAIADATSRAGVMHEKTVGMLAEKFTFKGGGDDLMKAVVQMGGRQDLVQRMRTENMSAGLLAEINNAILKTYDDQVAGRTNDRYITSLIAQGLTFDVEQIGAMRAFKDSFENGQTLIQRGLKEMNIDYSESISTMKDELFAPIQTLLIPIVQRISKWLTYLRNEAGNFWGGLIKWTVRMGALWVTIHALAKLRTLWTRIGAVKAGGVWGMIAGGLGLLAIGIYEHMAQDKKIAANKERTEEANRKIAIEERKDHERYLIGAMMTASLAGQMLQVPNNEIQKEHLRKLDLMLKEQKKQLEVSRNAAANSPGAGGHTR